MIIGQKELMETIYTSESALRHPVHLIRAMFGYFASSWQLGWRLTVRDISAQYRQSLFGILWAFVPPILATAVFVMLNRYQVINAGDLTIPYTAYAFTGITLWQLFTDSLMMPMKIGRDARIMIAKVSFPHESLIISSVLQAIFNFAIKLLLLTFILFFYKISVPWTVILFMFSALGLVFIGISIGVILLPFSLLYNDILNSMVMILGLWMFVTPVIYLPPSEGMLANIMRLNPVSPVLANARDMLFMGSFAYMSDSFLVCLACFGLLLVGWIVFRVSLPIIIERANA